MIPTLKIKDIYLIRNLKSLSKYSGVASTVLFTFPLVNC